MYQKKKLTQAEREAIAEKIPAPHHRAGDADLRAA